MTPERWAQIEELFHRAAECEPEHRTALLDDVCSHDPELRREVEALLSCQQSAGDHLRAAVSVGLDAVGFPLVGETISHYHILGGLGEGGMGLVYRAEDLKLGRQVALKFLPEYAAKDPAALGRFEREARSASALEHPHICPIYEFGEHEGRPFLVMQLLEGQTVRELIAAASPGKPPLGIEKLLDLTIQIVDGLRAAHQKGIVHRDIKPANIFVTSQGQAKILDFGLAKLAPAVTVVGEDLEGDHSDGDAREPLGERWPLATPDPFLSRTGVAMGTAGYMSPEQARGEKLDARTDLFSFGLVLYEMATGQRAFKGDTGPVLHDAILKQLPPPARQLNPSLPTKLEKIIHKALEKDRAARYQYAAEVLADLRAIKREMEPKPLARAWKVAVGAVVLLFAAATFWFARRPPSTVQTSPDLQFQQLTINSTENPVTGGAISPDGKYLAYTDAKGMHIKLVGTDEPQPVPQPEEFKNDPVSWEIVPTAWFPDSRRFVANAHPSSESPSAWSSLTSSIWVVSALGEAPRKLRNNAITWSVSPDGFSISFGTNSGRFGERELWLMGPNGGQPRKIYEGSERNAICCLYFFADGQRVSYISTDESGDTLVARDLKGGPVATLLPPSETKKMGEFSWLPGGQLIYSDACDTVVMRFDAPCNVWIKRLDTRTGKLIEKPRRLTNWAGVWMSAPSTTADGKRVAFLESSRRSASYVADLENGGRRLVNARRIEDGEANIMDWTADSKTAILSLDRGDHYALHRLPLNSDTPEPIVTSAPGLIEFAAVSPDNKWIIAQVHAMPGTSPSAAVQLLRVPITGGSPELIFSMPEFNSSSCAKPPSNLCAVAEQSEDHKQMIVTSFDPVKGRGPELARFEISPEYETSQIVVLWSLSFDGTRLAAARGPKGPIEIRSLREQKTQVIRAKELNNMKFLEWAADGQGLYVSNVTNAGSELVHVDLKSKTTLLWKCSTDACFGAPSPDGRRLAISAGTLSANVWMMENF